MCSLFYHHQNHLILDLGPPSTVYLKTVVISMDCSHCEGLFTFTFDGLIVQAGRPAS